MNIVTPREIAPAMSAAEQAMRVELAACYRLVAKHRMADTIYTHISARVPGPERHFLINPLGLLWEEITASSLVKIDTDGNKVDPSPWEINPAGFTIHSAIHMAREDAHCVLHTHTKAGVALSCLKDGLLPLNQFALQFYGRTGYHDYEGIATDLDERPRLVASLGENCALILRNHGLLTLGRTVAEAFVLMLYLERSCEVQLAAMQAGELILPPKAVCERTAGQYDMDDANWPLEVWQALCRQIDREDPSYRN